MARTPEQLDAWALLLEICMDDCEILRTSKEMRASVIEVERELIRLHQIEATAIKLACASIATRGDDDDFNAGMDRWIAAQDEFDAAIPRLVPEAFSAQGIEAEGRDPKGLGAEPESPVREADAPKD